jgi:hypothetical protein
MTRERDIESRLRRLVLAKGGLCFKFTSSEAGVPDRVVLHNGRVAFVELKQEEGTVSKIQAWQHQRILDAGAEVWLLWDEAGVDAFVVGL